MKRKGGGILAVAQFTSSRAHLRVPAGNGGSSIIRFRIADSATKSLVLALADN